jgi:DNA-binding IscR family transcriptional regulator
MPEQRIREIAASMTLAGLLKRVGKDELAPTRPPEELTLADISLALGGAAALVRREHISRTGQFEPIAAHFADADEATVEKLREISWTDLVRAPPPRPPKP